MWQGVGLDGAGQVKILYCSKDYSPHDFRMLQAILDGGHKVYYLRLEDSGRRLESRDIPEGVQSVNHWKGGTKRFRWTDVFSLALSLKKCDCGSEAGLDPRRTDPNGWICCSPDRFSPPGEYVLGV